MEIYERLTNNLRRLKANEEGMSAEQRVQYKKALEKLRRIICEDATMLMCRFLVRGNAIPVDDAEGRRLFTEKANGILAEEGGRAVKNASKVLFTTYSVEKFLEALLPLQCRIRYEAYGPVWLRHCAPCAGGIRNDIVSARWDAENGLWASESGHWVTFFLPPTAEGIEAEYREEMARFGKAAE